MAHFTKSRLETPKDFNFAKDVVGYWAAKDPESMAMYWVSQDLSETRILKYSHFERQSHRIAIVLQKLGLARWDRIVMILPRTPAWYVYKFVFSKYSEMLC
tara:strand:- start:3368 stop:3670 length:303 start_codon:yes stop_codon:yes gene_type:complete